MIDRIIDGLRSVGELGVILIAILDSSFLSIPEVNDLIVLANVSEEPHLFFYWPLLTTIGSVIGCLLLYWLTRKGGRPLLNRVFARQRVEAIDRVFARYGVLMLIIPALCPPPTPFKIFVASAGALQFPIKRFIATIFFARAVRYFSASILAVIYGEEIERWIKEHTLLVVLVIMVVVGVFYLIVRVVESRLGLRTAQSPPTPKNEKLCA